MNISLVVLWIMMLVDLYMGIIVSMIHWHPSTTPHIIFSSTKIETLVALFTSMSVSHSAYLCVCLDLLLALYPRSDCVG